MAKLGGNDLGFRDGDGDREFIKSLIFISVFIYARKEDSSLGMWGIVLLDMYNFGTATQPVMFTPCMHLTLQSYYVTAPFQLRDFISRVKGFDVFVSNERNSNITFCGGSSVAFIDLICAHTIQLRVRKYFLFQQ